MRTHKHVPHLSKRSRDVGYGDEDYSKQKEENEGMSEREEPKPAGKPGSIMGQAHSFSSFTQWPVNHQCSSAYGEGFFFSHGGCLWRWERLLGEFWCRSSQIPAILFLSLLWSLWWLALFVNLMQLRITWEEYRWGWSTMGRFVGMSVGDCLNSVHWFGKTQPTVSDAIP